MQQSGRFRIPSQKGAGNGQRIDVSKRIAVIRIAGENSISGFCRSIVGNVEQMIYRLGNFSRSALWLAIFSLGSTAASAQSSGGKDHEILLAPYLWGTSINGTSSVGGLPPLDIDASFGDLLSNLNFAMSLHTEFRFDDWVFVIDPTYLSLEMDAALPEPTPPGTVEVDVWMVELWAGYRLNENWEAIGGLRYQDQEISTSGLPDPPFPPSAGVSADWTDWFVGTRLNADIGDKWSIVWRGDVVIAGDSDTSWNTSIFSLNRESMGGTSRKTVP
jgi:hypothetical protein